ncbi:MULTISPECIES: hypothetical protein [Vibrio]|uniref:Uncharacterized protein n=1 Tax=Vibrio splendidus TaxID=29497 RepID=A0AB35MUH7_VIBSP|nr:MULTISPECIES: hypothetical protein [Vibrio]MCF7507103.1 hypothetical protein [Vibrio sp. L3-7]MDP2500116.1 hypothetical protein [Vibrio splendidus]OMO30451.1 hypothetical protein BH582_16310 [Vibrio sp. 10N.222.47.A9]PMG18482.1 hypothetical protein BCU95_23400 [Vibrio splendidus]PMN31957.1 hypothetical protein BCT36_25125 [Vibrio splendidus]
MNNHEWVVIGGKVLLQTSQEAVFYLAVVSEDQWRDEFRCYVKSGVRGNDEYLAIERLNGKDSSGSTGLLGATKSVNSVVTYEALERVFIQSESGSQRGQGAVRASR